MLEIILTIIACFLLGLLAISLLAVLYVVVLESLDSLETARWGKKAAKVGAEFDELFLK